MRYYYATCRTRERAEEILEECFAAGEVSEAEQPQIESYSTERTENSVTKKARRWAVTLDG